MQLTSNTILITGGASGIGLALAERFLSAGNRLVVCGRRPEVLTVLKSRHPEIETRVCDVSQASEREALAAWATQCQRLPPPRREHGSRRSRSPHLRCPGRGIRGCCHEPAFGGRARSDLRVLGADEPRFTSGARRDLRAPERSDVKPLKPQEHPVTYCK